MAQLSPVPSPPAFFKDFTPRPGFETRLCCTPMFSTFEDDGGDRLTTLPESPDPRFFFFGLDKLGAGCHFLSVLP